jgi:glycosyltransferase involved in cell wall biosynthesis
MTPLNVLWLIDHVTYDGSLHGGGRLFVHLPPAFDPDRVRIFPYARRASPAARRLLAAAAVPVTVLDEPKYSPATALTVLRLQRRHRIDVLHLFCYAASTLGRVAGWLTGTPTVIHDFDRQAAAPYPGWLALVDRLLAPVTSFALAPSPMCRDYLRDARGVPEDRIDLLPYVIPAERFAAAARLRRNPARAALGWTPNQTVFTTVTKLGPGRGLEPLLRAFERVASLRRQTRLVVVYPGEDPRSAAARPALDGLIARLRLGSRVDVVPSLALLDHYYAASDALVAPFDDERCSPVYLLEGFAHGRPAVASALGEPGSIIEDGRHGFLVPPGDQPALVAALLQMADDHLGREAMGQAAAALAQRYGSLASARRLTDLYQRLAARPLGGAALAPAAR